MLDVIIIGGGPAGFSAALYAARAKLNILVIEKSSFGGQMAKANEMENYPGFEMISGSGLAVKMADQAKKFGARIVSEEVTDVILDGRIKVVKTRENIYRSSAVILCMGASPKELGLPQEENLIGSGISYCATCDGAFFKGRDVAVIGGGDTAAEDALYLSRFCNKIFLVHRRDRMRATQVLQDSVFKHSKIIPIWNSVLEEIIGDTKVEGIKIRNIKTQKLSSMSVSGIFVAIGNVPNTQLVNGKIELTQNGYIKTDEGMRTHISGVFAAGDIREKSLRQVVTAASDGALAAYSAQNYINESNL